MEIIFFETYELHYNWSTHLGPHPKLDKVLTSLTKYM